MEHIGDIILMRVVGKDQKDPGLHRTAGRCLATLFAGSWWSPNTLIQKTQVFLQQQRTTIRCY
jgi:hypothetical protein